MASSTQPQARTGTHRPQSIRRFACGMVGVVTLAFAVHYIAEGAVVGLKLVQPRTTLSP